MKSLITLFFIICIMTYKINAQDQQLPYHQIPEYPEEFNANNIAARMVDGLGFRYYWATKDLREEDMSYKPSEESRTTRETLDHLYGLSKTIVNSVQIKVNSYTQEELSFEELRKKTLENMAKTSEILKNDEEGSMENYRIIFQRGESTTEYPFWNMINGPIADAIYHTGQVVAYRRASGNPIQKGVRMLTGEAPK